MDLMVGRPRICMVDVDDIRRFHREGKSYTEISRLLPVCPKTAQRYCTGKWKDYEIIIEE